MFRQPDVLEAFDRLKTSGQVRFSRAAAVNDARMVFIRNDEIVVDEGLVLEGCDEPIRFVADVDLVALRDLACAVTALPDVLDDYQRRFGEVSLPALLGALSLLVAKGILVVR